MLDPDSFCGTVDIRYQLAREGVLDHGLSKQRDRRGKIAHGLFASPQNPPRHQDKTTSNRYASRSSLGRADGGGSRLLYPAWGSPNHNHNLHISTTMTATPTPPDYLHRVYAGVLGKLIGVYLGRPFEGWTHQDILAKLGPIHSYVHDKVGLPLVVVDDDVSGTFTFVRALEEHLHPDHILQQQHDPLITSEQIGKTWLNHIVERRSTLWWGGKGISTEHTAYLNLKHGIPAPRSGSAAVNGTTVAEQIGAQIFIDGWALVSPGRPDQAAELAEAAGRVSHDGESVYAARLWAAMEAEAFVSKDVNHLLDVGLQHIPKDCLIARVVSQVREWVGLDSGDWLATRQRIEDDYGYDKFNGWCHVVPNHAVMIMALLYGGHDFSEAMHIVNTCGWDTDCNSGNVGCLVAIMHGLSAFETSGQEDWRGPLADRAILSGADGGYSINNAARLAIDIANLGRKLAGEQSLAPGKDGAQFHFALPGSVQGFRAATKSTALVSVEQAVGDNGPALAVRLSRFWKESGPVEVLTQTFTPKEVLDMGHIYQLMASPLVYPGQKVRAALYAGKDNTAEVSVCLRLRVFDSNDNLITVDSESSAILTPGSTSQTLEWIIPDIWGSQPIESIGIAVSAVTGRPVDGTVWLDSLRWDGAPNMTLTRPPMPSDFWNRSWINNVDHWHHWVKPAVCIARDKGEGLVSYGTREWTDYRLTVIKLKLNVGTPSGVAIRVQGLNRYYALLFNEVDDINDNLNDSDDKRRSKGISLIKALDAERIELARVDFDWAVDTEYEVVLEAQGSRVVGRVAGLEISAEDGQYGGGGLGFVVTDGSLVADRVKIEPV